MYNTPQYSTTTVEAQGTCIRDVKMLVRSLENWKIRCSQRRTGLKTWHACAIEIRPLSLQEPMLIGTTPCETTHPTRTCGGMITYRGSRWYPLSCSCSRSERQRWRGQSYHKNTINDGVLICLVDESFWCGAVRARSSLFQRGCAANSQALQLRCGAYRIPPSGIQSLHRRNCLSRSKAVRLCASKPEIRPKRLRTSEMLTGRGSNRG